MGQMDDSALEHLGAKPRRQARLQRITHRHTRPAFDRINNDREPPAIRLHAGRSAANALVKQPETRLSGAHPRQQLSQKYDGMDLREATLKLIQAMFQSLKIFQRQTMRMINQTLHFHLLIAEHLLQPTQVTAAPVTARAPQPERRTAAGTSQHILKIFNIAEKLNL
jgi:hypothetical protein